MFRFDNFCERWAASYLNIKHLINSKAGKGKHFFRHDTLDERVAFVQNLKTLNEGDLIMSCITAFDGEITSLRGRPDAINWRRHVIFWCRQTRATQSVAPMHEEHAADAKARAVDAAVDFIAFLEKVKDPHNRPLQWAKALDGVDFEDMELVTLPVSLNGWWAAVINFDHIEPRNKCVIDSKYDEELLNELFPGLFTNEN